MKERRKKKIKGALKGAALGFGLGGGMILCAYAGCKMANNETVREVLNGLSEAIKSSEEENITTEEEA